MILIQFNGNEPKKTVCAGLATVSAGPHMVERYALTKKVARGALATTGSWKGTVPTIYSRKGTPSNYSDSGNSPIHLNLMARTASSTEIKYHSPRRVALSSFAESFASRYAWTSCSMVNAFSDG